MNVYFIGMCISMVVYIAIGMLVSRKVKNANDYYVAGRRAPVALIAGSLIASYTSSGMFMGDAAQCYDGAFSSIILFSGMQSAGYIIGAVFFGRYLRRSGVLTIPEFFGKRFDSRAVRNLAAFTAIVMMSVYLLSVVQGIGTLMTTVTGVNYNTCIVIAMVVFTVITVISGSRGVLITDTLMASVFTAALLVSAGVLFSKAGGLSHGISMLAADPNTAQMLSWGGKPGALYDKGWENVFWGLNYGIVWMSVCAVGPWQSSRYLMAKDEHTVIKSAPISAIGVFILEFVVGLVAVFVNLFNYDMPDSSHVMIWMAMNMLPKVLGVVLLTGILAAGISSATTFLSLIGSSFANDVIRKGDAADDRTTIRRGQFAMVVVSVVVGVLAVLNPPSIFWIMFLGGAVAACAWMPVAFASILSKRVTKAGAFSGMLCGFLGCFSLRLYTSIGGVTLPVWLDPSVVGIVLNVVAMVIGTALTKVTSAETAARESLFVMPESEKDPAEIEKTIKWSKASLGVGLVIFAIMMAMWVIPYLRAV